MKICLEFKPQDLWIGVFWRTTPVLPVRYIPRYSVDIWICLVPMVPLHISFERKARRRI